VKVWNVNYAKKKNEIIDFLCKNLNFWSTVDFSVKSLLLLIFFIKFSKYGKRKEIANRSKNGV
jgi:hypothetical protein